MFRQAFLTRKSSYESATLNGLIRVFQSTYSNDVLCKGKALCILLPLEEIMLSLNWKGKDINRKHSFHMKMEKSMLVFKIIFKLLYFC